MPTPTHLGVGFFIVIALTPAGEAGEAPLCRTPEQFAEGKWITAEHPKPTWLATFPCCDHSELSRDPRLAEICSRTPQDHVRARGWRHVAFHASELEHGNGLLGSAWSAPDQMFCASKCNESAANANQTKIERDARVIEGDARLNYAWRPSTCRLTDWSADAFCHALGGRNMLFVGDSLLRSSFLTLTAMIHFGSDPSKPTCASKIAYRNANTLTGVRMGHSVPANDAWEIPIQKHRPHIIVTGVGAHVHDTPGRTSRDNYARALEHFERTLRTLPDALGTGQPPTVLWQTTVMGHSTVATWPYESESEIPAETAYNYANFSLFDRMAKERMAALNVTVLDLSPLRLRADHTHNHCVGDTLHFRAPGPLNIIAPLLLHALTVPTSA